MYNLRGCKSVNEGRYRKFELAYNPGKAKKKSLIKSFSTFDQSCIPPCKTVSKMHIKRCTRQAYIWLHTDEEDPSRAGECVTTPVNMSQSGFKVKLLIRCLLTVLASDKICLGTYIDFTHSRMI